MQHHGMVGPDYEAISSEGRKILHQQWAKRSPRQPGMKPRGRHNGALVLWRLLVQSCGRPPIAPPGGEVAAPAPVASGGTVLVDGGETGALSIALGVVGTFGVVGTAPGSAGVTLGMLGVALGVSTVAPG